MVYTAVDNTMLLTSLPSSLLEHIRRLSDKWQHEWAPVCKAFAAESGRDRHVVLPLMRPMHCLEKCRGDDILHIVSAQSMFPGVKSFQLREAVKRFPLPERLFAPFSPDARRWYFNTHHNLREVANCLRAYLEEAERLKVGVLIRSVELYLIVRADDAYDVCSEEEENAIVKLLLRLPHLETLKLQLRTGQLRDRPCNTSDFDGTFMFRILARVLASSTSIRKVVLSDVSLPEARWFGAGLLPLMQCVFTNDREVLRPATLLRLENVRLLDYRSDCFWSMVSQCRRVARLELVGTKIAWPSPALRKHDGSIFPRACDMVIAVAGPVPDPLAFAGARVE